MIASKELPARAVGTGESVGTYAVEDDQMAAGSTLGGPRLALTLKASGALEKVYSVEAGETLFGTTVLHFWDTATGEKIFSLNVGTNLVRAVTFSPDGKWLAISCNTPGAPGSRSGDGRAPR